MNGRWVHFSRRCAKMTEELGVRKRKRSDSAANQAPRKQAPPKYTKEYLDSFEGTTVPDIGSSSTIKLLFVGINPGLRSAAVRAHFAGPSNRFYKALFKAGLTSRLIDCRHGYSEGDIEELTRAGIGITNVYEKASRAETDVPLADIVAGGERLEKRVRELNPDVVCVLGLGAFRKAFGIKKCKRGKQDRKIGGVETWVIGNPSGLNGGETVDMHADWYKKVALRAGIQVMRVNDS